MGKKIGQAKALLFAGIPLLINIVFCFVRPGSFVPFLFDAGASIFFWQFARGVFNIAECLIIFFIGALSAFALWKFPSTGNVATVLWISAAALMIFGFFGAFDPPERYRSWVQKT